MKYLVIVFLFLLLNGCKTPPPAPPVIERQTAAAAPADETKIYAPFTEAVASGSEERINKEAKVILETHPDDPYILNGLAHHYRKSGRLKMAETLTKLVLSKHAGDLRAKRNLAHIYLERQEDSRALQTFLEIHAADKNFPGVAESIANLYMRYDRPLQALQFLRETIDAKDLTLVVRSDSGRGLAAAYLNIIEGKPDYAKAEETMLKKLAEQNADPELSGRAKSLLGKAKT